MDVADFDYELPEAAIAQHPIEPRDAARLLVDRGPALPLEHRHVSDLAELVGPGDLIVVNDSRVLPARLRLHKFSGGAVEVLLLERRPDGEEWEALVRPSRKVPPGTDLVGPAGLIVSVGQDLGEGRRSVRLRYGGDQFADDFGALDAAGEMPLPPYIHEPLAEAGRYQTVYADRPGSVAAPTAGLHLTDALLDRCRQAGAEVARVELQVGLGTFRPITVDKVESHAMHGERYAVTPEAWAQCAAADRVLAVGTTVVRTLESAAATGELTGRTELFIHGDYEFQMVDRLLTNFHVPKSSLLVMIDAFVGPRWREVYAEALARQYRFLSFGDAMLLERR